MYFHWSTIWILWSTTNNSNKKTKKFSISIFPVLKSISHNSNMKIWCLWLKYSKLRKMKNDQWWNNWSRKENKLNKIKIMKELFSKSSKLWWVGRSIMEFYQDSISISTMTENNWNKILNFTWKMQNQCSWQTKSTNKTRKYN